MNRYYQILISAGIGLVLPGISHASLSSYSGSSGTSSHVYTFSTSSGATDSAGEAVNAQASFSVSSDSMVVSLVNLQTGITSVGQNVSSVFFTLNNCGSILSLSPQDLNSSSGNEVTVGSGGVVTSTQANASLDHWQTGTDSGGQSYLNDLSGGGSPDQTVIGPSGSNNDYSTVNRSIYDNAPHNPFVQNEAKFTVKFPPGVLGDNIKISDVKIGFGTQSGDTKSCVSRPIPEPGTLPLLVIGVAALGMMRCRRHAFSMRMNFPLNFAWPRSIASWTHFPERVRFSV